MSQKQKPPRHLFGADPRGLRYLTAHWDSIVALEQGFEPIVYETPKDARNDSFHELTNFFHRYHPLYPKETGSDNDTHILQRCKNFFNATKSLRLAKIFRAVYNIAEVQVITCSSMYDHRRKKTPVGSDAYRPVGVASFQTHLVLDHRRLSKKSSTLPTP